MQACTVLRISQTLTTTLGSITTLLFTLQGEGWGLKRIHRAPGRQRRRGAGLTPALFTREPGRTLSPSISDTAPRQSDPTGLAVFVTLQGIS